MQKRRQTYYFSAIRLRSSLFKRPTNPDVVTSFTLVASKVPLSAQPEEVYLLEQVKNKQGVYIPTFDKGVIAKATQDDSFFLFEVQCTEVKEKITLPEDSWRKLVEDICTYVLRLAGSDSEESDDGAAEDQDSDQAAKLAKNRGRPKGSRNRQGKREQHSSDEDFENDFSRSKRNQHKIIGRPKGAKNRKRSVQDEIMNEINLHSLFGRIIGKNTIDDVKLKLNKNVVKAVREVQDIDLRRRRGRPKGARNTFRINVEESECDFSFYEDHASIENVINQGFQSCCSKCLISQQKRTYLETGILTSECLFNATQNLGIQDMRNLIVQTIKNSNHSHFTQLLKNKEQIKNDFIVCWDLANRFERVRYTVRTRKEYNSSSKKDGTCFLLEDCAQMHGSKWWSQIGLERLLESLPNTIESIKAYEILIQHDPELKSQINFHIPTLIRCGNLILAKHLLTQVMQTEQNTTFFGYSHEHLQCLGFSRVDANFKKSAYLRQNGTSNFLSPIHCACINGDSELLNYLLKNISGVTIGDSMNRKPIHYAALAENSKNLQLLLKYGSDLRELDRKKITPLILAVQNGRVKNVKIILEKVRDGNYINNRDEQGLSALHYAILNQQHSCLGILAEDPLVDMQAQTKERMNILHLAAGLGDLTAINLIVSKKISPEPDSHRRTPMMVAIKNHHNNAFFALLNSHIKKRFYARDGGKNSLLHYAAAYGKLRMGRSRWTEMDPNRLSIMEL